MSTKPVKVVGVLSMVGGLVMIVAGAITWFTVSSQLSEENITVPNDAPFLAGAKVAGPFSALAQAETIKRHALKTSEGKSYAELGQLAKEAGSAELKAKYQEQRNTVMNGSFLRASLFTSVVAYGVAALVVGIGLIAGLVGWALFRLASVAAVPAVVRTEEPQA